jgi:hypothetical protein
MESQGMANTISTYLAAQSQSTFIPIVLLMFLWIRNALMVDPFNLAQIIVTNVISGIFADEQEHLQKLVVQSKEVSARNAEP